MGRVAILCGGQGAQAPGMADALGRGALVDEVFEAASDVCGFDVRAACGDASALADAERVQPALCAVSIASARLAQSAGVEPGYVAGFSLGQVAALNVAGMLSLEQTFSLCSARARAMAKAAEKTPGAMCALSGADEAAVEELIDRADARRCLRWRARFTARLCKTPRATWRRFSPMCDSASRASRLSATWTRARFPRRPRRSAWRARSYRPCCSTAVSPGFPSKGSTSTWNAAAARFYARL